MPWGFAAAAVGTIAGSAISGSAAKDAANTQADAARNAAQVQQNIFDKTVANEQPYINAGNSATSALSRLLGIGSATPDGKITGVASPSSDSTGLPTGYLSQTFGPAQFKANQDPGYGFQLQSGNNALMNSAAAGSGSLSGSALKSLIGFNQDYANTGYQNAFDRFQTQQGNVFQRLSSLAGQGQAAAANVGAQGTATGGNIGANIVGAGNASAAGTIGAANAASGALSNLGGLGYLYSQRQPASTSPVMDPEGDEF